MSALLHSGFMYTHDSLWHVERLQDIASNVRSQFPVRWSPGLDHGYGIPLFNFTYPGPYYLGAVAMFFGLGPLATFKLLLFLSYLLGGLGVYMLGKKKPVYGVIASLLYLLSPYWFLDIFVRGALGEVMALGLIPWVFLAMQNIEETGRVRWFAPLPLALLLISHNFYGFLFTGLLLFFTIVTYKNKLQIIKSIALSLGLSAFFLLPALFEKSELLIAQAETVGYRNHFVSATQLISPSWHYLGSQTGQGTEEMSYQLGLANVGLLVLAIWYFRRLWVYLSAVAISLVMMFPASNWLWAHLPLLSTLQFPWRFLGIIVALLPLIYVKVSEIVGKGKTNRVFLIFSVTLVLTGLINTMNYKSPLKWLNDEEFLTLHYEYAGGTTTAYREELVPKYAPVERYDPVDPRLIDGTRLAVRNGAAVISEAVESPLQIIFTAVSDPSSEVVWYRNFFPSWSATVDGEKATLSPSESGEIILPLHEGTHEYQISLRSTPIESVANLISVLSLCAILTLIWRPKSG